MQPDEFVEDLRGAWQAQPAASPVLTSALLRRIARRMVWKARATSVINLTMLPALALFWAGFALVSETLLCRIGCGLLALGTLVPCYGCYSVYRMGGLGGLPEDRGLAASLTFYRANLIRRRKLYRNPLFATLSAQTPGVVVGILGWMLSSPDQWVSAAGVGSFWVAANLLMWRVSQRESARLGKEVALLDWPGD